MTVSHRQRTALTLMGLGWLVLMLLIAFSTGYWGYFIVFAVIASIIAWRTRENQ
jgi:hypothetical protein